MNQKSQLEPVLLRETKPGHWMAWDSECRLVLSNSGPFEMVDAVLRHRGYTIISPNSAIAMGIRNRFRANGYV